MLDVFSTENILIQHKILIGLKDQFDFKIGSCNVFMKIRPVSCVSITADVFC